MLWQYTLLWFGLTILAVVNGAIRNSVYSKTLGDLRAHQVSTVSLMIIIGIYTWIFTHYLELASAGEALLAGLIWVSLTILFEFVFGHYVVKKTWEVLLRDYNMLRGRIWVLVPIWTFLAPLAFFHLNA